MVRQLVLDSQLLKDDSEEILEIKELPIATEDNFLEKKTIRINATIQDSSTLDITPRGEISFLDYKVMGTDNEMSFNKLKVTKTLH
nr:BPK_HP1_G0058280.mRNA.1.CDS.1 [Saccharomyces cerevisiae]